MLIKSKLRLALFVHYQNFIEGFRSVHPTENGRIELQYWEYFYDRLVRLLHEKQYLNSEVEIVKHVGTWLIVGESKNPDISEKKFLRYVDKIDRLKGMIVCITNKNEVTSEIICQMLIGGFNKRFDLALLVSDDNCLVPAVQRLQDYLGINVIQVGFDKKNDLRPKSYGNLNLEDYEINMAKLKKDNH